MRHGTGEKELAPLAQKSLTSQLLTTVGAVVLTHVGQKKRKSSSKRWQSCGWLERSLHELAHTLVMEKPQKVVVAVLLALLAGAWALVIFVATIVTQTMLDTLSYIIELAQLG